MEAQPGMGQRVVPLASLLLAAQPGMLRQSEVPLTQTRRSRVVQGRLFTGGTMSALPLVGSSAVAVTVGALQGQKTGRRVGTLAPLCGSACALRAPLPSALAACLKQPSLCCVFCPATSRMLLQQNRSGAEALLLTRPQAWQSCRAATSCCGWCPQPWQSRCICEGGAHSSRLLGKWQRHGATLCVMRYAGV